MQKLDMDGRYRVARWPGVAVWVDGWVQRWEPWTYLATDPDTGEEVEVDTGEGEWVDDPEGGLVKVVMVGDDYRHTVDVSNLKPLEEDDYCSSCGQIGCGRISLRADQGAIKAIADLSDWERLTIMGG